MPITIRGYGHGEAKPVLEYTGSSHNHWEIRGSHLIVQGLEFDTANVYSIRIRPPASNEVDNVTLVNNTFVGCGGGCISANDSGAIYANIRVIDSLMLAVVVRRSTRCCRACELAQRAGLTTQPEQQRHVAGVSIRPKRRDSLRGPLG